MLVYQRVSKSVVPFGVKPTTEAWATFQSAEIAHHFVRVIHDQHLHLGQETSKAIKAAGR